MQMNGIGAKIAFCRGGARVNELLRASDELVAVDGNSVRALPTVEVCLLVRSCAKLYCC